MKAVLPVTIRKGNEAAASAMPPRAPSKNAGIATLRRQQQPGYPQLARPNQPRRRKYPAGSATGARRDFAKHGRARPPAAPDAGCVGRQGVIADNTECATARAWKVPETQRPGISRDAPKSQTWPGRSKSGQDFLERMRDEKFVGRDQKNAGMRPEGSHPEAFAKIGECWSLIKRLCRTGSPVIVVADECSSGSDPCHRRVSSFLKRRGRAAQINPFVTTTKKGGARGKANDSGTGSGAPQQRRQSNQSCRRISSGRHLRRA